MNDSIKMDLQMIKFEENRKVIDKETYSKFLVDNYDYFYKTARKNISNEDDARDIVQDTIRLALLSRSRIRNEKHAKTYVTKILINQCKKYYQKRSSTMKLFDDYASYEDVPSYMDEPMEYDTLVDALNKKEQEIFDLRFKYGYTEKEISAKLGIKEGTIKSIFSRGGEKIKKKHKGFSIAVFILCMFISAAVIAVSIISYIQNMFRVRNKNLENKAVLDAIETKGWFQKSDMDYVDLGDGYKIKLDYFLLDEMSLYLVFDLESEKDLSKYNEFSILDLKVENENSELIYDKINPYTNQYKKIDGTKNVENSIHHIKQLIYIYTDSFPISNGLNISFSRLALHKKKLSNSNKNIINSNLNISVSISEMFKNRNYANYVSDKNNLRKALISETGFYAIVNLDYIEEINATLIDENGNKHNCFVAPITIYDNNEFAEYIIVSNYNNKNARYIKLIVDNIIYELKSQP